MVKNQLELSVLYHICTIRQGVYHRPVCISHGMREVPTIFSFCWQV
jgi:hypothetical protein